MNLLDTYSQSGNTLEGFAKCVRELDSCTHVKTARLEDLALFSVIDTDEKRILFHRYDREQWQSKKPAKVSQINLAGTFSEENKDLIRELAEKSKLLISSGKANFFTSSHLSRDLGDCARVAGDSIYDPTEERDMYLMSRFCVNAQAVRAKSMTKYLASKQDSVLVYRTNGSIAKIFAMGGSTYKYLPQTSLLQIIQYFEGELGKAECKQWYVDHFFTQIWIEFPEKAEDIAATYKLPDTVTPGLLFETSDTRDCAYTCTATYRIGGRKCYVIGDNYSRKHIGTASAEKIFEEIKKKVYASYTKLPERLCELMLLDIENPKNVIAGVLEKVGLQNSVPKGVGKIGAKKIVDALCVPINPAEKYTGYDIAMMLLGIPEMIDPDDESKKYLTEILQKIVMSAVFVNFKDYDVTAPVGFAILPA